MPALRASVESDHAVACDAHERNSQISPVKACEFFQNPAQTLSRMQSLGILPLCDTPRQTFASKQ